MRLHRFYIGDVHPSGANITINSIDLIHQWKNVFRMHEGDEVILFNTSNEEYICALETIDRKSATLRVRSTAHGARAQRPLILCAALVKKDNFDLILQKATELGATEIIPIISERSEKKGLNKERAERILIEASEQCGRTDIPKVHIPTDFEHALDELPSNTAIIGFDPTGTNFDPQIFTRDELALFIGPEGGWAEHEIDALQSRGKLIQLPTFVLRAETAAIAAMTLASTLRSVQK